MIYFFFWSYTATRGPSPFLYGSTFWTYLLKIYWAIQQDLVFTSFLPKIRKYKKTVVELLLLTPFFLQLPNLLKWNPKTNTEIILWCIFQNNYYYGTNIQTIFHTRSVKMKKNLKGATNYEILSATMVDRRRKSIISNSLKLLEKRNNCRRQVKKILIINRCLLRNNEGLFLLSSQVVIDYDSE